MIYTIINVLWSTLPIHVYKKKYKIKSRRVMMCTLEDTQEGRGGGGDNDGGGSMSGRSRPWCPAPISSCRSSSHSCPLVTSSHRWAPPRRSGRTGHGRGRLPTGNHRVNGEWQKRDDALINWGADNPPLSSSSCAHTVRTHTSLLMTYTRLRLRREQTEVIGHEEGKKNPMSIDIKYCNEKKRHKPAIF